MKYNENAARAMAGAIDHVSASRLVFGGPKSKLQYILLKIYCYYCAASSYYSIIRNEKEKLGRTVQLKAQ